MTSNPGSDSPGANDPPVRSGTAARWIEASDAADFAVNVLMDPERKRPVVAVTTHRHADAPTIDLDELTGALKGHADVVALRTGEATWELSAALPSRLDVYDGAARIWWPGLTTTSDPYDHPLMFIYGPRDAEQVARRIVAAICGGDRRAGRFGTWTPRDAAPSAPAPAPVAAPPHEVAAPGAVTKAGKPILSATVASIDGSVIRLRVGTEEGVLGFADEKLDALAASLTVGQTIPVFLAGAKSDGTRRYSTQGLLRASPPRATTTAPPPDPIARSRTGASNPVLEAVVTKVDGARIHVSVDGEHGVIADADVPLEHLAADLADGETVRVRRMDESGERPGRLADTLRALGGLIGVGKPPTAFSTRGLRPDPWKRIAATYSVGDIVRGRVCKLDDKFVLVELLPSAALLVPISELDYSFVKHPADVVRLGERVKLKLLDLDPPRRRGTGSIKQAYMGEPVPAIAPGPGQPPFLADADDVTAAPEGGDAGELDERVGQLQQELESTLGDRAALMERLRGANDQVAELRRELRSAEDRFRALEQRVSGDLDPTSSEIAFLTAVRVEYARRFNETDRRSYPLQAMRVGREFLQRLRDLDGISVEKVVEVCAQVASLRAKDVPGREVHECGDPRAPGVTRPSDGAKGFRCSLQDNTASARRLQWWEIPGREGRTIEFASVAIHDDFSIPA